MNKHGIITRKRFFRFFLVFLIFGGPIFILIGDRIIRKNANGKLFSTTEEIPYNKVGLLLGTSKYSGGNSNLYYNYRINAAVELWQSGKIKYIVVSGDNSRPEYDEPTTMRKDLIANGVDSSVIYLDYAGFRTLDSVVRAKEIFGQSSVTIISQPFHNERAIYLAEHFGLGAIGYNAQDVESSMGIKTRIREKFARVKVFLDLWLGKEPKFLGEKVVVE